MEQKIKGIDWHRLGRTIVLNDELYLISEKRFNQIFGINKPIPKKIKVFDEKRCREEHQKLCNKVRKFGKLMGEIDRILRDD